MCKRFLKCNHTLFVTTALALFTLALLGCKKQIDQTTKTDINSSALVTMEQIKQWAASFLPTIADQPTLAYELTQKKMLNGRSYLRVPTYGAGSEGGFFYFTKNADGSLQSLYVLTDQKDKTKPDGVVSFVDFDNKTYTLATYQNNKPVALYSLKDNKGFFEGVFTNKQTGFIRKQVDDACAEQTSIIKLPDGKDSIIIKKVNGGIECPGFLTIWQKIGRFFSNVGDAIANAFDWLFGWMGGGGSGYSDGAFGSGGYSSWNFTDFWGLYGVGTGCTNCSSDPAGGGWWSYDPRVLSNESPSDEPMSNPNSSSAWWDDNVSDPNTYYYSQPRPSFSQILNNYPKYATNDTRVWDDIDADGVYALLGGEALNLHLTQKNDYNNACALRVSRALNYSGVTIPAITNQTIKGADGKNYFIKPEYLKNWMTKTFGPPDIHKTIQDVGYNNAEFKNSLLLNKGIYIMIAADPGVFRASGHATLFLGLDCIKSGYYTFAKEIFFWKLP